MNWDLTKLYAGFDDPAFSKDMEALADRIQRTQADIQSFPRTGARAECLHALLEELCAVAELQWRVDAYVSLTLTADSSCEAALAPRNRMLELRSEASLLTSAMVRLIGGMEDLEELCAGDALLEAHSLYFKSAKEAYRHLMDAALEPVVLKLQMTGGSAWSRLRDELDSGLMIDVVLNGQSTHLPLSAVRGLAYDADGAVRRAAYEAELKAYPAVETPMAACLNAIKGEARTMAALRKYETVLDAALDGSRMDRATLDALLAAIRSAMPMFRRYFRLKAQMLGHADGLPFYDLFAPVGDASQKYTLDQARDLLIYVFGSYNPEIAAVMERAFSESWIDSDPREGKVGGAFCEGVHPLKMSYILTNFDGNLSSVSTLAHELGHAFHDSRLAEVSALLCDVPMPLAETASTFNELLLSEALLKTADRSAQISLLEQQLCDAAQVIVDIMSRFLFESEVVERRRDCTMSAGELCEIMRRAQQETYGDGLNAEYLHPYMWACKPHYYDPDEHFYNFPYAFGQLFATGLYALYLEKGEAFWPMYDRLLRASGSGSVCDVAASAGIDVHSVDFWLGALEPYRRKLEQLEALARND